MAVVYDYICKECGTSTELDHQAAGKELFHYVPLAGYPGLSKRCGGFRRDWSSVNVARVPGGGRPHRG